MENIHDTPCGKTCREHLVPTKEKISEPSSKNSAKSKTVQPLFLDLRATKESGKQQDLSWQTDIQSLGESLMHNFGEFPNAVEESSLWQILEVEVPDKYYLSKRACRGVLQRAVKNGVELPPILLMALISQGEITEDELNEIGIVPPPLFVLNDQGGESIGIERDSVIPTLRAQAHGNLPILAVYSVDTYNYSIGDKARTLLAGHYDKDGLPCVAINLLQDAVPNEKVSPCLSTGNPKTGQANIGVVYAIDRAAFNQGKNVQYKIQIDEQGISHTLVAKGPGAVCYPVGLKGDIAGTLDASYWKGCGERNGTEREVIACPTETKWIVRRVTPIECARLQGMPDWWCKDIKHADNAEYKMWGNGMALPCVMYVMQNLTAEYRKNLLRR